MWLPNYPSLAGTSEKPDAFPENRTGCIWALTSHPRITRRLRALSEKVDETVRVQIEPARVTVGKSFSGSNTLLKKFVGEYIATSATISMTFIRVACIANGFQIGVTDLAAGLDDFTRKLDGGVPLRVAGMALPSENDFIGGSLAICSAVKL